MENKINLYLSSTLEAIIESFNQNREVIEKYITTKIPFDLNKTFKEWSLIKSNL